MAPDQIYQPIVCDDDDRERDAFAAHGAANREPGRVPEKARREGDHLTVEEAAVQRSRRPDPESCRESPIERPILFTRSRATGPISVNEATDALRWSARLQTGRGVARRRASPSTRVNEMATDAITRGERIDPLAPPPPEVVVLNRYGDEENEPLTVTEAANQLTDWRARHAEAQQQELQELVGEAEQERAEAQHSKHNSRPNNHNSSNPTATQPQPQPEMTPAQIERAQIAAEREHVTNLKKLSGMEAALRNDYDQLVAAVVQEFPSLRNGPPNPADVEQLRVQDPQRFQKLAHGRSDAARASAKDRCSGTPARRA